MSENNFQKIGFDWEKDSDMAHCNLLNTPYLLGFFKMALQNSTYLYFIDKMFLFFYFSVFTLLMCHKCHTSVFTRVTAMFNVPYKCHQCAIEVPYLIIFTFLNLILI